MLLRPLAQRIGITAAAGADSLSGRVPCSDLRESAGKNSY